MVLQPRAFRPGAGSTHPYGLVLVNTPLPRSDFILQPQITIIKIDTPGALEGRPSLQAGSWRDV